MEQLIEKAKIGDSEAYVQLITIVQNDLYRIAKARLSIEEDICDAIQETMITGYQHLKNLKENEYFKTWIIKILINKCIENFNLLDNKDEIKDTNDKLDFENILKQLNYEEKLIITLYYNSRFSIIEIAEILKININTVKSKILRTKKKIKKIYEEMINNE